MAQLDHLYEKTTEVLGHSTHSVVYRGWTKTEPRRAVAIKTPNTNGNNEGLLSSSSRRLKHESDVLKQLRGVEGVVQYLDYGEIGNIKSLVEEIVPGQPLTKVFSDKAEHPVPTDEQRNAIFERIFEIVSTIHDKGVLHLDLKPEHIIVDRGDQQKPKVTLIDFGIAKGTGGETRSTGRWGTPGWCSPEQNAGKNQEVTVASDLWTLGAILLWSITKKAPVKTEDVRSISREVPDRPRKFFEKAFQSSPAERFQSSKHMADEWKRHSKVVPYSETPPTGVPHSMSSTAPPLAGSGKQNRYLLIGVGLIVVLLQVLIVLVVVWRKDMQEERTAIQKLFETVDDSRKKLDNDRKTFKEEREKLDNDREKFKEEREKLDNDREKFKEEQKKTVHVQPLEGDPNYPIFPPQDSSTADSDD